MQGSVIEVLHEAGIKISGIERGYRPSVSLPDYDVKMLKPQNIVEMLHHGSRDIGFAGADWVAELGVELIELLDTQLDPVRIVAAAPSNILENNTWPKRHMSVATEYPVITQRWIEKNGLDVEVVRAWGATEVFPPEDADFIVDNTSTGSTLKANGLTIVEDLMHSSTRLYASPRAMEDDALRVRIERFAMLVRSVLEARKRVMLEVNVSAANLEAVIAVLPCMRGPTVAPLHHGGGYAVKAAVPRAQVAFIIPEIKAVGGTDIIVTSLTQIVP